ncbi:phage tail protein [Leuconostoc citreum]|uniref:phage tail protein n=1 Tax=Leuconostoc citreum TaxID=33964 RepID=UPI0021A33DB2|nr:phage tail protein [Leuconostoc citreum]MCT3071595.1 hypothetical protein [Leuconostoc citreum]
MIKFKNIKDEAFLAVGTIQRKFTLNGEKSLSGILYDGDDVLNKFDKGWSLEFDGEPYVVTYFDRNDSDNTLAFDAIHEFFWKMAKSVLYTQTTGSHTVQWYLDQMFANTGYTYALNFSPKAISKDNWGMKTKIALFNDIISSIGSEFEINGTLISIFEKTGTDLSTIVRYGFNLSDMSIENNAAGFVTYGEGFGAYADQQNQSGPRLHTTYTSPLASVYGILQAEPVDDQRYTVEANLIQAIKEKVDNSFAVSIKLSLYDLRTAGYPYKMANVGDWLMAIDEKLNFKQRIRIIAIDDEFDTNGNRISYTVTAGNLGIVQKYQEANASLSSQINNALASANEALNSANQATISANGKNTSYYLDGINDLPTTANNGDLAWVKIGDGSVLYIYTKKSDGNFYWKKRVDPETGEQIADGVNNAVTQSKDYSDKAIADNKVKIDASIKSVDDKANKLKSDQAEFDTKAQGYADQAKADAIANTSESVQQTAKNASDALAQAKADLTGNIAKEATDRQNAVNALDKAAQGYANQAKSDAISAATTADGVINKKIDDTASGITATISQNKKDAEGKISTAQTTAQTAVDGLKTKVSQTDYDKKTGQLQTDLTSTTQTATQAKTDIVSIKQKDGDQDSRMNSLESDAKGTKQTISDIQTTQGKQSGSISTLQQRADGFDATVNKVNNLQVGGRNYVKNSTGLSANGTDKKPAVVDWRNTGISNANYTYDADGITMTVSNPNSEWFYSLINAWTDISATPMLPGKTYTISVDAMGTVPGVSFRLNDAWVGFNPINSSTWTRVSATFTNASNATRTYIRINASTGTVGASTFTAGQTLRLRNFKLEDGNFPTAWSPAPEDVDSATAKAQLTADQATTALSNYMTDADGRISKAQADITATAKQVQTKVSQTDYDQKTGDLSTKVSTAQQTADSANTTIGDYKKANDGRVSSAESAIKQNTDAISSKVSQTDYDQKTGKLDGQISSLNQTAKDITTSIGKVSAQVNDLKQVNLVNNSQLTPDYAGWHINNPWGTDIGNELTNNGISDASGAMYVWHDQGNSGNWLVSEPIPVNGGQVVSESIMAAISGSITSGVPLALYLQAYDSDKNRVLSTGYNIPLNQLSSTFTTFKFENLTLPQTARYASFVLGWNAPGKVSFGKPMLVLGSKVGDYVVGSYNNNSKLSVQQQKIDSISSIVSDPNTGLTKRVQTAEGFMTSATDRLGKVENKATSTADGLTREIKDRTDGDNNSLQQGKDFTTSQISNSESGMKSFVNQTISGLQIGAISSDVNALKLSTQWQTVNVDDLNNMTNQGKFFLPEVKCFKAFSFFL